MHLRKGKKILIYFFLLISVGSINNISFNGLNLKSINEIKVSGLEDQDNAALLYEIKKLNLGNIFFIDSKEIKKIISTNSLVEKFEIFKNYPYSLNINVQKTNFLAKINKNGKIYLIGSNAKISKTNLFTDELPFIFGKPEIINFLNLKKKIDQSKFSYKSIKNLYFYPSKRWDIELKNNILIKLPKDNVKNSLDQSYEFLANSNLNDVQVIDARFKNQIITK